MAVSVEEDLDEVDGGYAVIRLPQPLNGADPGLRITRLRGEPDRLGEGGWQTQPATLTPRSAEDDGGAAEIKVGPEICRHINDTTEVRIEVPSIGFSERIVWPYIPPSVQLDTARGAVSGQKSAAPQAEAPDRQVGGAGGMDIAGAETSKASSDAGGGGSTTNLSKQAEAPTEGGGGPGAADDFVTGPDPEPKPGSSPVKIGAAVVAALVVLAGAYVFFAPGEEPTASGQVEPPVTAEPADPPEAPEDETTAEAPVGPEPDPEPEPEPALATSEHLMQAARDCVTNGCGGADFFDIGEQLLRLDDTDNAFRVMVTALNQGSGDAGMWLGEFYDPRLEETGRGDIPPDPALALSYYRQAADTGVEDAIVQITGLCSEAADALDGAGAAGTAFEGIAAAELSTLVEETCQ